MGSSFGIFTNHIDLLEVAEILHMGVVRAEIRALTAVLGPLIIAHFSAFVKRENKKVPQDRMSCGNCVHFIFGFRWIDEHITLAGLAPTTQ